MQTVPVGSLETLLETLDYRRPAAAAHSRRVAVFARHLGVIMGLPGDEMATLVQAALVHEAGALVGRPEKATDLPGFQTWCGLSDDVDDVLWYATRRFDHHRHAPRGGPPAGRGARLRRADHRPGISRAAVARERPDGDCARGGAAVLPDGRQRAGGRAARALRGGLDVSDAVARPDGPAAVDADRLRGGRRLTIDYRFVTTS